MYLKNFLPIQHLEIIFSIGFILFTPINCNNLEKNLELASLDEHSNNYTQALYRYELILKDYPNNKLALKRMGMILVTNPESWGVGISLLETALDIDPNDDEIRKELFYLYLATENKKLTYQMLTFWKTKNQTDIYKDLEALSNCEWKIGKIANHFKTVDESPYITEFWKKRCSSILSNLKEKS